IFCARYFVRVGAHAGTSVAFLVTIKRRWRFADARHRQFSPVEKRLEYFYVVDEPSHHDATILQTSFGHLILRSGFDCLLGTHLVSPNELSLRLSTRIICM
ncbi:unnamed protein product, partial [Ectocarpus sp. 4 AP-2014]